ncbi:MAG: hypothetical protein KIS81_06500 [Maricaulaceae bacterium]|nr:hypothetical protein [Maricaulaceae bacterium]
MTTARKEEDQYLSADERELVAGSHHPALGDLPDDELKKLVKLVRERRDRAADIARRQRREMRGKARPQGAKAASGDAGTRIKISILSQAMKRLNSEASRRNKKAARAELAGNMRKALEMKKAAAAAKRPASQTASKGMKKNPNRKNEQLSDPREVGRVSQQIKKAQAKRDGKKG